MRKISGVRPLPAVDGTLGFGRFWWGIGSHGDIMSRTCRILRGFGKSKLMVYSAWIKMREKLEVARQGGSQRGSKRLKRVEVCVSNCSDLSQKGKEAAKDTSRAEQLG